MHPQVSVFGVFLMLFSVCFSVSFFSVLKTFGSPKRAPLDPLLGPKMEPKSFQGGLEVACHGQSENLQIPCVLQYFCGPVRVPSRLKIVFKAVLSSSLGISIFVSFLNPFRSSKKVTCSVKWPPQEAPKCRSRMVKMSSKFDENSCF